MGHDAPIHKTFNGKRFTVSAATRHGVAKVDAQLNQKYLEGMGFKTRRIKRDNVNPDRAYLVYGHLPPGEFKPLKG